MEWMRNIPEWLKPIIYMFIAKELTMGEWVKLWLSQAYVYVSNRIVAAVRSTWDNAQSQFNADVAICAGLILTVVTTAYLTTAFIQGRHRTGEKLTQETNTTNTSNTTPTNIIQVHSALQLRTEPQLHSNYTGNTLEPFQMGNNFTVWWAKLKICLKDTPNNQWAQQAIMSIDDKVLNRLGGDISRYSQNSVMRDPL